MVKVEIGRIEIEKFRNLGIRYFSKIQYDSERGKLKPIKHDVGDNKNKKSIQCVDNR